MKAAERKEEVKGCVSAGVGMWGRGIQSSTLPREGSPSEERRSRPGAGGGEGGGGGAAEQGSLPLLREVVQGSQKPAVV